MPAECFFDTRENACPTFQAPIRIWNHIPILIKRVHLRWAHEETVLWLTFHAADLLVNSDVAFFVDFEHISSEFLLYPRDFPPLYLE